MNETPKLVTTTDNDPQRAFSSKVGIAFGVTLLGIIAIVYGWHDFNEVSKSWFAETSDYIFSLVCIVGGLIDVIIGLCLPFSARTQASVQKLYIYEDHIDGKVFQRVVGARDLPNVSVHETYDKIGSVSTGKDMILVNLKDGRTLRCLAYNADTVASAIRSRIK